MNLSDFFKKINEIIMNAYLKANSTPTKIGQKGLDLIKEFEGFESKPYLCPAKIPTIGWGSTFYPDGTKVKLTDEPITQSEGEILLKETVKPFETAIVKNVSAKLNQNQFDALVSFAFNVGIANFKSSTLLKKVNQNPNQLTIGSEFAKWNKATVKGKKVELKGLIRRRKAESDLYFSL